MKPETPTDRLDQWVTQHFGVWHRFERAANVPHATVTAWRKGTVPDPKRLQFLAQAGLDVHWLLTGTTPPRSETKHASAPDPLTRAIPYLAELPPIIRTALVDLLAREGVPQDQVVARAREVWRWVVAPLEAWGFDPALDPTGARQFPGLVDYLLAAFGALRLSKQRALRVIVRQPPGPEQKPLRIKAQVTRSSKTSKALRVVVRTNARPPSHPRGRKH